MKKNFKRIVSLILCLVILCCPFANVMQPAHAANPGVIWAAGEGVYCILAFVFGLLGISFISKGEMVQAGNQFLVDNPTISQYLTTCAGVAVVSVDGQWKFQLSSEIFRYFTSTLIPAIQDYFTRAITAISVPDNNNFIFQTAKITSYTDDAITLYNIAPYTIGNVVVVTINGVESKYSFEKMPISADYLGYEVLKNGAHLGTHNNNGGYSVCAQDLLWPYVSLDFRWGFNVFVSDGNSYLQPYAVSRGIDKDGKLFYTKTCMNGLYAQGALLLTGEKILSVTQSIPYDYDIDYSKSEFMNALEKIYQSILAIGTAISIPWDGPVEDVEEGKKEVEENTKPVPYVPDWAMWWEKLGIKDLIETLTQNKTITESDVKMPELPMSIKDKFPFCVPFDVYYMIEKLNATSVAPSWNIPFKIQSLGINQNIPLDLSGWESVAAVCRWANVLLFILALVLLTRNIIRA